MVIVKNDLTLSRVSSPVTHIDIRSAAWLEQGRSRGI